MEQAGDALVLSLAELLGGKQVDSNVIGQALAVICAAFDFDGGLIYELDQYNHLNLKERCVSGALTLRESFSIDAIDPAYRSHLAMETFVRIDKSAEKVPQRMLCWNCLGLQALVVVSVVDETLRIYGLLAFVQQEARPSPTAGFAAAFDDGLIDVWPLYRGADLPEQADLCQKFVGKYFG